MREAVQEACLSVEQVVAHAAEDSARLKIALSAGAAEAAVVAGEKEKSQEEATARATVAVAPRQHLR